MTKFLSYLFLMCLVVGLSVLVMMYGWGLKPQSWWWIIGGGIFGNAFIKALLDRVGKEDEKKR